jgi:hypothetical protein
MTTGRIALISFAAALGIVAFAFHAQALDLARPNAQPFASATLYFDSTTGGVSVLSQNNVSVAIRPAQYQDMDMSRAFYVECHLAPNVGLRSIGVWATTPAHLIPADVVDYHTFDPTYVSLDIDTAYFENRSDNLLFKNHEIHIEFFEQP